MWLVTVWHGFRLFFAVGKIVGTPCMRSHIIAHRATPPNYSLTPLFSETKLKGKDFQEVARLAWAHAARLQQLHPSLLAANVSNKSGNLKDRPAAECLC